MRKLAVALALASTALASPVLARDNSWYVGVGGGVTIVEDLSLEAGGGEYPVQDGFGWTNGVYLAMKEWLRENS